MGTEIGKAKSKGREEERGGAKEEGERGSKEGGWRKFGLLRQSYASLREGGREGERRLSLQRPHSLSLPLTQASENGATVRALAGRGGGWILTW